MNTPADDATIFAGEAADGDGLVPAGPTLYEWACEVAAGRIEVGDALVERQARGLGRGWHAPRAFYGRYLRWAFDRFVRESSPRVRVYVHQARAVALQDGPTAGCQQLRLDDPAIPSLTVNVVVLTQGHVEVAATPEQDVLSRFADRHGLIYMRPQNAAEVDLSSIDAGAPVVLRGLGLAFTDYVTSLTTGRGGRFCRSGGRLRYASSGQEPVIFAGSGRGVPHLPRAASPQALHGVWPHRFLDDDVIRGLRGHAGRGTTDFLEQVWPVVAKEVEWAYYTTLLALRGDQALQARFTNRFVAASWDSPQMHRLLEEAFPDAGQRWDWQQLRSPARGLRFDNRSQYQAWILDRLLSEVHADGAVRAAHTAAVTALRRAREQVRQVVSFAGISGGSYRDHVDGWFHSMTNFLVAGPPLSRTEELVALGEADVVQMVGPGLQVSADEERGQFLAGSPSVNDEPVAARALVEAHLPSIDVRRSTDPLLEMLIRTGAARAHVIPDATGSHYRTGGLDVTEGEFRVVALDGTAHPARFALGVPLRWVQGPFGTSVPTTLRQADSIARAALSACAALTSQSRGSLTPAGGDAGSSRPGQAQH